MKNITLDKLINIEDVDFEFLEPLSKNVKTSIKIGERCLMVSMPAGSIKDLSLMKSHIERIILEYKLLDVVEFTSIFDRTTVVNLRKISLNNKDSVTRVTATRIGHDEPMASFYCRLPQVVSSIYMALLGLVQMEPDYFVKTRELDYGTHGPWSDKAAFVYNRIQSAVIEDYIFNTNNIQHCVASVEEMMADYAALNRKAYTNTDTTRKDMIATAKNFLKAVKRINYRVTSDLSLLLPLLTHIKLKDGYRLKYYCRGEEGTFFLPDKPSKFYGNFNSYICIENIISREIVYKNLYTYFEFDFNEHSVWEFYLLLEYSKNFLPAGWHGTYSDYKIILGNSELARIKPSRLCDSSWMDELLNLYTDNPLIAPNVKILNHNIAKISLTVFTNWGGLEQHHIIVENHNGNIKYNGECKMTLKYYDCGELC